MKDRIRDRLEDRGLTPDELIARIVKRKKEHQEFLCARRIMLSEDKTKLILGPELPLSTIPFSHKKNKK